MTKICTFRLRINWPRALRALAGAGLLATTLAAANTVKATPSLLGFYPSSDIFGDEVTHFNVTTYGAAFKTNVANSVGLTRGLGNREGLFGRSEFGFDYLTNGSGIDTGKRIFGNAKTQLFSNPDQGTRLVAGAWLLGDTSFNPNVVYLLGAKSFDFGRIHVGYARALTDKVTGQTNFIQLGYDRALSKRVIFAVDYYSGGSFISGVQPSLYYAVNDRASFGVGIFRANNSDAQPRHQTYIGFDYNFGKGVDSPPANDAPPRQGEPGAPGDGGQPGAAGNASPGPATP